MLVVGQEIVLGEVLQKPIANQRLQYLADHRREAHWTIVAGFLPAAFLSCIITFKRFNSIQSHLQ